MPKLRRLNGKDVVTILQSLGFEVTHIRGSHYYLRRVVEGESQNLNVPVHGSKPIPLGTLRAIYRQAREYLSEEALRPHFYT